MALKINIKYSDEGVQDAIKSAQSRGSYDGPVPPAGIYNVKLRKLRLQRNKRDTHYMFAAWLVIDETGDLAKYNGASINEWLIIPNEPSEQYADFRYNSLNDLFAAASKGKMNAQDVLAALTEGRYQAEDPDDRGAQEVTAIGKLKLTGDENFQIKTKMDQYEGKDQARLHYILSVEAENEDDDLDYLDDDVDLDDLLEG